MTSLTINKSAVEQCKTILIAVLITGAVAFVGGYHYATKSSADAIRNIHVTAEVKDTPSK